MSLAAAEIARNGRYNVSVYSIRLSLNLLLALGYLVRDVALFSYQAPISAWPGSKRQTYRNPGKFGAGAQPTAQMSDG